MNDPFKKSPVRRVTLQNLEQFRPFLRRAAVPEDPELYAIAKKITLEAGFPYIDPRTLETTQPPKQKPRKKRTMSNSKKMPKWVLLDQLHIDINVKSDMPEKVRKNLTSLLKSKSFETLIQTVIEGPDRKFVQVKISR